ncbi:uncharacterized protein LOC144706727 [Wolffia australiana]
MPSVAAIALETLIEPGASSSSPQTLDSPPSKESEIRRARASFKDRQRAQQQPIILRRRPTNESEVVVVEEEKGRSLPQGAARSRANGYYISPQLYTTPEAALIVPTSGISSSSPSPYVVNHKRRDLPRLPAQFPSRSDETVEPFDRGPLQSSNSSGNYAFREERVKEEEGENCSEQVGQECLDLGVDEASDVDFFDPREVMSTRSSSDAEDASGSARRSGSGRCGTPLSGQSEFYDAHEDFIADASFSRASLEADLRSIRLNLFEEIERRKMAEEAVEHLQNTLQRMHQLWQETVVMRMVTEALETAVARTEAEAAAEAKNREIARFNDRLQYYEAVNREMCQRNQEAIELARQQRQKKKTRQKWMVGCVGLSLAVGASVAAYFYVASADGSRVESGSAEGHPSK